MHHSISQVVGWMLILDILFFVHCISMFDTEFVLMHWMLIVDCSGGLLKL